MACCKFPAAHDHGGGHGGHGGHHEPPVSGFRGYQFWKEDLSTRKWKCFWICFGAFVLFICSAPLLWAVIDKPKEFRRTCLNPGYSIWSNLFLGWEILMIILSAVYAYYTNELGHIIHPVFIMLLITALFVPPTMVSSTGAHLAIDSIFNPAVKIVVGTLAEAVLIMVPTIYFAYWKSAHQFHHEHHVAHEVRPHSLSSLVFLHTHTHARVF